MAEDAGTQMIRNRQLVTDYQSVFGSPEGQRILADLRKRCPFLLDSIDSSRGIDVNRLIYLEGQRSVLLHIYKMLRADPNQEPPPAAVKTVY